MKKIITPNTEQAKKIERVERDATDEMIDALRQESLSEQETAHWSRVVRSAAARFRRSRKAAAEGTRKQSPQVQTEELPF